MKTKPFLFPFLFISVPGIFPGSCMAQSNADRILIDNAVLKIVEERDIPARTSGPILRSEIREGVLVQSGQLVMEIDNEQTQVELKKSRKELEMAKLEAASRVDLEYSKRTIEVAEAELGRAIRSNQRRPGVVPQSELDQLSLVVKKSLAEKEKTEFQIEMRAMSRDIQEIELELNRLKNDFHQIKSPLNGMIVEVHRREGEWVEASESIAGSCVSINCEPRLKFRSQRHLII